VARPFDEHGPRLAIGVGVEEDEHGGRSWPVAEGPTSARRLDPSPTGRSRAALAGSLVRPTADTDRHEARCVGGQGIGQPSGQPGHLLETHALTPLRPGVS